MWHGVARTRHTAPRVLTVRFYMLSHQVQGYTPLTLQNGFTGVAYVNVQCFYSNGAMGLRKSRA